MRGQQRLHKIRKKLREFIITRPVLQKILNGISHTEIKIDTTAVMKAYESIHSIMKKTIQTVKRNDYYVMIKKLIQQKIWLQMNMHPVLAHPVLPNKHHFIALDKRRYNL